jgi:hypothetical protein
MKPANVATEYWVHGLGESETKAGALSLKQKLHGCGETVVRRSKYANKPTLYHVQTFAGFKSKTKAIARASQILSTGAMVVSIAKL